MYYIDDYRRQAVEKIIPYLIDFPEIISIIENGADRYQLIEDILWKVADNFRFEDARGVFLNAHAHNVVVDLIYTDRATDAFTYGAKSDIQTEDNPRGKVIPSTQGYGAGHYYDGASYLSGKKKTISEDKLIRAIKSKIIQNTTNGTIEDFIEAIKLMYNADGVKINEVYPMGVDVTLIGSSIELSSSGNYINTKRLLPICTNLRHIYLNENRYNIFGYNKYSSYDGDSRYPSLLSDTQAVRDYKILSKSLPLNASDNEYIKIEKTSIEENDIISIQGTISSIVDNCVVLSQVDEELNYLNLSIEGSKFIVNYKGTKYDTNLTAEENIPYVITFYNNKSSKNFEVYINKYSSMQNVLTGKDINTDLNELSKQIVLNTPKVEISDFEPIESEIYINCLLSNGEKSNFCNFIYDYILFANYDVSSFSGDISKYYVTCFGDKQILFNCIENKDNLLIYTDSELEKDLFKIQSNYNYKEFHSNSRYAYFDGKSYLKYKNIIEEDTTCKVDSFDIKFSMASPISNPNGIILGGFLNTADEDNPEEINSKSVLGFENGKLFIKFEMGNTDPDKALFDSENKELYDSSNNRLMSSPTPRVIYNLTFDFDFSKDTMYNIEIKFDGSNIRLYIDGELIERYTFESNIYNLPKNTIIGCDNTYKNLFKGILKDVYVSSEASNEDEEYNYVLDIPFVSNYYSTINSILCENYGMRFITTPQLISDTTSRDIYGSELIKDLV